MSNEIVITDGLIITDGCIIGPYSESVCDSYYADVTLLLSLNGANGSTSFPDTSPIPRSITRAGSTQISTAQSKFGGSSAYFDGNGDYLTSAPSADWAMGTLNFTMEAWVYFSNTTNQFMIDTRANPSDFAGIEFSARAGPLGYISAYVFPTTYAFNDLQPTFGTWNHIALVRSNNVLMAFLNGVKSSSTYSLPDDLSRQNIVIGTNINNKNNDGAQPYYWFDGYMNDVRITKGKARYTSTFAPANAAFQAASCTLYDEYAQSLNLNYRWRLNTDLSSSGATELSIGSSSPILLTKGSGSFNGQSRSNGLLFGTEDSICLDQTGVGGFYTAPITVDGTQDFTLGMWINLPSTVGINHLWGTNISGNYAGIFFGIYGTTYYLQYGDNLGAGSGNRSSWNSTAPAYTAGQTVFLVFYSGTGTDPNLIVRKLYVNGVQYAWTYNSGSATTIAYPSPGTIALASYTNTNSDSFRGLIDDVFFTYGELSPSQILQLYNRGI